MFIFITEGWKEESITETTFDKCLYTTAHLHKNTDISATLTLQRLHEDMLRGSRKNGLNGKHAWGNSNM